jgi:hypothetical protein
MAHLWFFPRRSFKGIFLELFSADRCLLRLGARVSRQKIADDVAVNIGQAAADAVVAEGQLLVINAQQI